MKNLKKIIEYLIIYMRCVWMFKQYIQRFRLEANSFDMLFDFRFENLLDVYVTLKQLNEYEIGKILKDCNGTKLVQVMKYRFNEEQQNLLISKKDAYLLEKYFHPTSGFDISKRFSKANEQNFICMVLDLNSPKMMNIFKQYVDNTIQSLLSDNMFELVLTYNNWYSQYLMKSIELTEKAEQMLLETGYPDMVKSYISSNRLRNETAQIMLINNYPDLCGFYIKSFRFCPKAYNLYASMRAKPKNYGKTMCR